MHRFIFIGTDGSCGYKNGEIYKGKCMMSPWHKIMFYPEDETMISVPYTSMKTFKANWEEV